jgi:hypothetical protein
MILKNKKEIKKYKTKMNKDRAKIMNIIINDDVESLKVLTGFIKTRLNKKLGTMNVRLKLGKRNYPIEESILCDSRKCFNYMLNIDADCLNFHKLKFKLLEFAIEKEDSYYFDKILGKDVNVNNGEVIEKLDNNKNFDRLKKIISHKNFDTSFFNNFKGILSLDGYEFILKNNLKLNKNLLIFIAIKNENIELLKYLLNKNVDLNVKFYDNNFIGNTDNFTGFNKEEGKENTEYYITPLIYACYNLKRKAINFLLNENVEVNKTGYIFKDFKYIEINSLNAFLMSNKDKQNAEEYIKLFVKNDIDLEYKFCFNKKDINLFYFVFKFIDMDLIEFIIKNGLNLDNNALFYLQETEILIKLFEVIQKKRFNFIYNLIDKVGIDILLEKRNNIYFVNKLKNNGYSPIIDYLKYKRFDEVSYLISNGLKLRNHLPSKKDLTKSILLYIKKNLAIEYYNKYLEILKSQ